MVGFRLGLDVDQVAMSFESSFVVAISGMCMETDRCSKCELIIDDCWSP